MAAGVQVPSLTQLDISELSSANMNRLCLPVNVELAVTSKLSVRLLPDFTTEVPFPVMVH